MVARNHISGCAKPPPTRESLFSSIFQWIKTKQPYRNILGPKLEDYLIFCNWKTTTYFGKWNTTSIICKLKTISNILVIIVGLGSPSLNWAWHSSAPACFFILLIELMLGLQYLIQHSTGPVPRTWITECKKCRFSENRGSGPPKEEFETLNSFQNTPFRF